MRIFIAVVVFIVLMAPVALAHDSSRITRLERKLADALRTIEKLEKRNEKLAKSIDRLNNTQAAFHDYAKRLTNAGDDLAKADKKANKQMTQVLKKLDKKADNAWVLAQQDDVIDWVRKRLGLEDDGLIWGTEPTVARWVKYWLERELSEHESNYHRLRRP